MISARELLTSVNILDQTQTTGKRHPKNEFQAYAYRLAYDLKDLDNLHIYMRLSKSIERSLLESAYSFVLDSTSSDKGRLFLWRLKQLRLELQKHRDSKNFEYDFVMNKMAKFRDSLSEMIQQKSDYEFTKERLEFYKKNINPNSSARKKKRVLIVGNSSKELLGQISSQNFNITALDISKILTRYLKNEFAQKSKNSSLKIMTKELFKTKFAPQSFNYIILNNFWSLVPLDFELKFIAKLQELMAFGGKIILSSKTSTSSSQEWKSYKYKNLEHQYFYKNVVESDLIDTFSKLGFTVQNQNSVENLTDYIFQ
jgi:2-polyprenyl-3-methyl-5-hydroxy-6-metoxy-1,4-benzoquinol methylase